MTDFARTPAERKRKQWAERQRRQRIRDALALTDDRGGLSESKATGPLTARAGPYSVGLSS